MRVESDVSILFSRENGNCSDYVRTGWSAAEPGFRWSEGEKSVLALPPIGASPLYVLTCSCGPYDTPGRNKQELGIEINGLEVYRGRPDNAVPNAILVPGHMLSPVRENIIALHNHDVCVTRQVDPPGANTQYPAFAWYSLDLTPYRQDEFMPPVLLPEPTRDGADISKIATAFQSLGQSCEFGLFQRRCQAEPLGLMRFASVWPFALYQALAERFNKIDDLDMLSLEASAPGGELMGYHAIYGLDYHTFIFEGSVDVAQVTANESKRLGYLARMMIEQLETNDKFFVRRGGFSERTELRALHMAMRHYHADARLLYVDEAPPGARNLAGRVEWLAPGLYKGYLDRFAPPENAHDLSFDVWLRICETVFRFDACLCRPGPG